MTTGRARAVTARPIRARSVARASRSRQSIRAGGDSSTGQFSRASCTPEGDDGSGLGVRERDEGSGLGVRERDEGSGLGVRERDEGSGLGVPERGGSSALGVLEREERHAAGVPEKECGRGRAGRKWPARPG
ncbi:hypothetical protein GCM10023107_04730 [Actinoplanes octamycinicus]